MDSVTSSGSERLQKILSRAGIASRRAAEQLIREGRVTVNGEVAEIGGKANLAVDSVKLDGKRVTLPGRNRYLLLNKPSGYITTRSDPEGRPTVFDLLPPQVRRRLFAVGRLDFDTEGLLLLTDDGDLAHRVSHPRHGCSKSYEVKVHGRPSPESIAKLRSGIVLGGRRTHPAKIQPLARSRGRRGLESNSWWRIELTEGRTRQIREMFDRVGHQVLRLRRVAIGPLSDARLRKGTYRELTEREVELFSGLEAQPRPARGRNRRS